MPGRIRRSLTFANVSSFLALTIALGTGGAYAADTIGSTDIIDESIQSVDIKNGEVKAADIGGNQVTSTKIYNGSVTTPDIHADAVDGSKILDAAIANADIANGAVNGAKVLDESLTSSDLATDSVQATEIADDSIDGGEIVNESLGTADLAANSVAASELADNSVASANVLNNSITTGDIAGAAANGAVSLSGIANGRCVQFTISVPGAAVGEVPIIANRAAIQDGVFMYATRVPAAGQVEAVICNFSGGAMTPLSNFPIRTITIL